MNYYRHERQSNNGNTRLIYSDIDDYKYFVGCVNLNEYIPIEDVLNVKSVSVSILILLHNQHNRSSY